MFPTSPRGTIARLALFAVLVGNALIAIVLADVVVGSTIQPLDMSRVEEAIIQRIRFEMYWWGRPESYRQGATLPLKVASDGRRFVAMVEDFELLPDGRSVTGYFRGVQGEKRTWIVQSSRTPVKNGTDVANGAWWRVEPDLTNPSIEGGVLTMPADGVPRTAEDGAAKERMRHALLSSVREQLSWNVARRGEKLPPSVTLVVADFNVEDPTAFVLVEDQDKVYEVYLFDPGDPTDPRYREGPFLVWPVEGRPKAEARLRSKVRELGAAYEVTLSSRLHEATMVPTP
jgi:hypothetical protein